MVGVSLERIRGALLLLLLLFQAQISRSGAYGFLSCLLWFCVGLCTSFSIVCDYFPFFPSLGSGDCACRLQLTSFLLDCLSWSVPVCVPPLWEGRRVPLPFLVKRPLQDAPVGAGGREGVLTAPKCHKKKKKEKKIRQLTEGRTCPQIPALCRSINQVSESAVRAGRRQK